MRYSILDLFAGSGGFSHGFKKHESKFIVKLANDIWKPAYETYTYNNPNTPFILGDIKELTGDVIESYFPNGVDAIIGGPPCQGFSMIGTRDVNDKRNGLFYEYAKIVNFTKPYIFIMENVKGLLSMKDKNGGLVIDAVVSEFSKLGYNVSFKVLNAKYYNVPQSRERVIIVGTRDDLTNNYEYPKHQLTIDEVITVGQALQGLPNQNSLNGELTLEDYESNDYMESMVGDHHIYNHVMQKHSESVIRRMSYIPQGGNWVDIPPEYRTRGTFSNSYTRLRLDKPSQTITNVRKSVLIHPTYNRILTIRETARLQSFDDNYVFKNTKTSQYQQLANAVPPNLAKAIASSVYEYLMENGIVPTN